MLSEIQVLVRLKQAESSLNSTGLTSKYIFVGPYILMTLGFYCYYSFVLEFLTE